MRFLLLPSILIFFLVFVSDAQENQHSLDYNVSSGMLSNITYYGMFDKYDFLWICQNHGLSRFDGTNFRNFTVSDGLPDDDIIHVVEDTKGTIWAQPFQREPAFLKKNAFRFQNVNTIIPHDTLKKDQSYKVFALKDGKVGLVTEQGVIRILRDERLISSYHLNVPNRYHDVVIYETDDKKLILLCSSNKFIIDITNNKIKRESFIRYSRAVLSNDWICFQHVLNGPKLFCLNTRTGEEIPIENIDSIHRFGIFKKGVLLNQNGANLSFFDFEKRRVINLSKKVVLSHAAESKTGDTHVFFSAENGIHILNQESPGEKYYQQYTPAFIYLNRNRVYVSDILGNLSNTSGNKPKNISFQDFDPGVFAERINGEDLIYGSKVIISNPNDLGYDAAKMMGVKAISILNDSIRYVATRAGAFSFNNRSRKAKVLYLGRSTAISAGPNGSVFIGTIRGLLEITKAGKLIDWSESSKFKRIRITDLCFRKGVLWVATAGEGLSAIFNGKAKTVLNSYNGTSKNYIETVEESDNGQLYIGYSNGAQMLSYEFQGNKLIIGDLVTLDIFNKEGIHDFFFHSGIVYGLSSNRLYQFDTRKKHKLRSFKLQITRFLLNQQVREVQRITQLKAGKYNLEIELSTQNFQRLPIQYRYRVNDEEWNYLSSGSISLDQLGSGDYQITIEVLNNYNRPSDSQIITVSIAYPFYFQSWFLIGMGGVLMTVSYLMIRFFTRRQYQKLNIQLTHENKLRELELIALKAQINPHFVFNCLNSIKALMFQKRLNEADIYIDRFAQLFRNTLEASFEHIYPLASEIAYLQAYLEIEQMSMNYRFDFEFIIDPSINTAQIFMPTMLLQPHVENAVKHGVSSQIDKKGLIKITFLKTGNYLLCSISDNGRKRTPDEKRISLKKYTGKGLFISEKRAQLHGIDMDFLEQDEGGVTVILKLKISNEND